MEDKTHGSDDFAVVINGKVKDVTGKDDFTDTSTLMFNGAGIAEPIAPPTQSRAYIQNSKWGYTAPELKNARFTIFLQNNGTTATLEVAEIFNFNGVTYELDQPSTAPQLSDDELKSFATKTFALKKTA